MQKQFQKPQIVCAGSALVDLLLNESDQFLSRIDGLKGSMTLVAHEFSSKALAETTNLPTIVPGGSACNTAVGIGRIGAAVRFVGKCGTDSKGVLFERGLHKQGVHPWLYRSQTPTGRCLSVVTPDAQRTMFTYLGASSELQAAEIAPDCFNGALIVHVEGYLVFNHDLISAILKTAKAVGARVSLDLASFNVVEEDRRFLIQLVRDYVDILIANEDEARAYTRCEAEARALEKMAEDTDLAVLKVGARGSFVRADEKTIEIPAIGIDCVVDTTGAGDLWAAGFLYGMVTGMNLAQSARIGSLLGAEVCQVMGASIPDSRWPLIRQQVDEMASVYL